jgi:outer membrane protein OmpA-like peptidoglycan-associated protein
MKIAMNTALVLAGSVAMAGCVSAPDPQVEQARQAVQNARDDRLVQAYAPTSLRQAEQALTEAEHAHAEGEDQQQVDHLAYLAEREAAIAQMRALEEQSQQEIAGVDQQIAQALAELQAEPTERGVVVTLEDVLFEVNGASLRPGAQTELARLATFLRDHPSSTVQIEGHTDNTGSPDYNLQLSALRAESVRSFLVAQGVEPLRLQAIGFGEARPEAPNDTAAGRQQNRRVELVIQEIEPIGRVRGG